MKWIAIVTAGCLVMLWLWFTLGILASMLRMKVAGSGRRMYSPRVLAPGIGLAALGGAALVFNTVSLTIAWLWFRLRGKPLPPIGGRG